MRPGERDSLLLLECFRDPHHRRELLAVSLVSAPADTDQPTTGLRIPSLELCVLDAYVSKLPPLEQAKQSDVSLSAIATHVWKHIR